MVRTWRFVRVYGDLFSILINFPLAATSRIRSTRDSWCAMVELGVQLFSNTQNGQIVQKHDLRGALARTCLSLICATCVPLSLRLKFSVEAAATALKLRNIMMSCPCLEGCQHLLHACQEATRICVQSKRLPMAFLLDLLIQGALREVQTCE